MKKTDRLVFKLAQIALAAALLAPFTLAATQNTPESNPQQQYAQPNYQYAQPQYAQPQYPHQQGQQQPMYVIAQQLKPSEATATAYPSTLQNAAGRLVMNPLTDSQINELYLQNVLKSNWYSDGKLEKVGTSNTSSVGFLGGQSHGITIAGFNTGLGLGGQSSTTDMYADPTMQSHAQAIVNIKQKLSKYIPTCVTFTNHSNQPQVLRTADLITGQKIAGITHQTVVSLLPKSLNPRLTEPANYVKSILAWSASFGLIPAFFALFAHDESFAERARRRAWERTHPFYEPYPQEELKLHTTAALITLLVGGGIGALIGYLKANSKQRHAETHQEYEKQIKELIQKAYYRNSASSKRTQRQRILQPGESFTDIWLISPDMIGTPLTIGNFTGYIE